MWRARDERLGGCQRPRIAARHEAPVDELPLLDAERLGALFQELLPRLIAVALRYTRDPDAARDVVQNAFEKVVRHGDQFRGGSKPSTWIHRIVANEALMWLRAERRRQRRWVTSEAWDQLPRPDPSPTAAECVERASEVRQLARAVAALREDERVVVEQCALEGRTYEDLGQSLGVHAAAVKSRAFRARRQLRRFLGPR